MRHQLKRLIDLCSLPGLVVGWLVIVLIVLFAGTEWIVRRRRDLT